MPRNKYPEETVQKILDASLKLFLEKGYENTTIQDIVDELGGLTKGAIYHHFKSKEDIICALSDKLFAENDPFAIVKQRKDLNALQKMREAVKLNQQNTQEKQLKIEALPLLKNPRIFAEMIKSDHQHLTPLWLDLIEEGIADGTIQTDYPKEIAELIPLLGDVWLYPNIFPATEEEIVHKFLFFKEMLEKMGVPILDDDLTEHIKARLHQIAKPYEKKRVKE